MEKPQLRVEDMSIMELKAVLFDIDNEMKQKQNTYNQISSLLQQKIQTEITNQKVLEATPTALPVEEVPKTV